MRQASTILTLLTLGGLALLALDQWSAPARPGHVAGDPVGDQVSDPVNGAVAWAAPVDNDAEAAVTGVAAEDEPADLATGAPPRPSTDLAAMAAGLVAPKPVERPDHVAAPSICDDPRLVGRPLDAIAEDADDRCGADNPVRLASAAGVQISPEVVTSCALAVALADWLEHDVADHAQTVMDQPVVGVDQISGYVCRNRNNAAKGRLSLHALAQAVDIARFHFADGAAVSVEDGWAGKKPPAVFLRAVWNSACDRFGTVLGPDSDEWHRDHFHLDAAERRTAYCR